MKLHQLSPNAGSNKNRKRVGRGQASGWGKTGARGMNGQNSRTGGGVRLGFEGGQTPMYRRLPKRGFNNARFATEVQIVNIEQLAKLDSNEITKELLKENRLIHHLDKKVKVLGKGELNKPLSVKADLFSASAKEKIEQAGGTCEVI